MNYYLEAFKRYIDFQGRSSRPEFWYFVLFNTIVSVILALVDSSMGTFDASIGLGFFSGIYALAVFLPSLAVAVRRLHDTSHSAWYLLIALIPIAGLIVLIVLYALAGDKSKNRYGLVPKRLAVVRVK